ncbi:prepilin-type N-terminal cleavage/methylation domain-containing protein [Candidatus Daviesbacteria bacterium]|nr:prepilin-type N-terminal cleavage/methylation domain-containing protein [Candidatus Daviesbacteria bacterium]
MKGFTFIELILVLAIMLTLSVMAPSFYSRFILQNVVDNAKDQLSGSLRKAQVYSMTGKQGSSWSVNFGSNTITLYKGTSFPGRDSSFDEKFSVNPNVSISWASDISFTKATGLPTPASGATITISSGSNSKTVIVNSQGVVNR